MNANPNVTVDTSYPYSHHHFKNISWSAIFVGAFVGLGLNFLLNLFCVSIGLSVVTTTSNGVASFAIGSFIGLLISVITAMFVAGMVAGYLGRAFCPQRNLGALYGFTAWSVALVLLVTFASHMSHFVTSYTNTIYNRPATVNVVNNNTAPAVTLDNPVNPSEVTVNAQPAVNNLGYTAFLVFVLFFVGALSGSIGGHYGMGCKREEDELECGNDPLRKNYQPHSTNIDNQRM